jgi:pimeloyl-ACP methyl ester carboxylesterase
MESSRDMGPMSVAKQYVDGWWTSADGLQLHYRDYSGTKSLPPVICIPGLTRNARDFSHVAERIAQRRRVICVDLRGRGESEFADPETYTPVTYAADIAVLVAQLKIRRFVAIGTSLGGVVTMLLAAAKPGRIVGAVINDIGPVVEAAGLERIKANVGRAQSWPTWVHAARDLSEIQREIYPRYGLIEWIALAKRLFKVNAQGRVVPDYDPRIAEPLRADGPPADLWPIWQAMGDVPVTLLRGALSDILSPATAKEMVKRLPSAKLVTVSDVGHAPALDEASAMRAIDALLKVVDERQPIP